MTDAVPKLLIDTCSLINLSYCPPAAALFRDRYRGQAGWAQAARDELVRQRLRKPPHPQAGKAANWAVTWLGTPIGITGDLVFEVEAIQRSIAAGSSDSALDHLGEAASIAILQSAGTGRLISDDHAARDEARRRSVRASSTVGVIAQLLTITGSGADEKVADQYLEVLRAKGRMHAQLTSDDLLKGEIGPWR